MSCANGIPVWVTRGGKRIRVNDMDTSHIQNALAMLKRDGVIGPSTLQCYLTSEPPTADMALMAFENEFQQAMEAPVNQMVDCFECELSRRKED
jgi:hypothetical protein